MTPSMPLAHAVSHCPSTVHNGATRRLLCSALLAVSTALSLSACAPLPQRPAASDGLKSAYAAMTTAMDQDADDYAHDDLELARSRYTLAVAQYTHNAVRTQQLAEESRVLAELAMARTDASKAAELRAVAQKDIDEIEAIAKPPSTSLPTVHRGRRH